MTMFSCLPCLTCRFAARVPCSLPGCDCCRPPSCRSTRECRRPSPPSPPPATKNYAEASRMQYEASQQKRAHVTLHAATDINKCTSPAAKEVAAEVQTEAVQRAGWNSTCSFNSARVQAASEQAINREPTCCESCDPAMLILRIWEIIPHRDAIQLRAVSSLPITS